MSDDWAGRFDFIDWGRLEAEVGDGECSDFRNTIKEWRDNHTDKAELEALEVLYHLLLLQLSFRDDDEHPLGPEHILSRLPPPALRELVNCLTQIKSHELRARIVDAAWLRGRQCDHQLVRGAVDDYVAEAKRVLNPESWTTAFVRLQRAVSLAASLGRGNATLEHALNQIEAVLVALGGMDPLFLSARLAELLQKYRHGDAELHAKLLSKVVKKAAKAGDVHRAVTYLEVESRSRALAGQHMKATRCRRRIAELLEKHARRCDATMATHFLEQAIQKYRTLPDGKADAGRLRVKLQRLQRKSVKQLAKYEESVDLSDCVVQAKAQVAGLPTMEALLALCRIDRLRSRKEIEGSVRERFKDSPMRALIPQAMLNSAGRVVARNNGIAEGDGFEQEVFADIAFHQSVVAAGGIQPAVETIRLEHGLRQEDFLHLASRSAFVPNGRHITFSAGLSAGLYGDYVTAAHLLVPQLENSIRLVLENNGAVTTTLASTGIQREKDLGQLLVDPIATDLFGEGQILSLRALLTEQGGSNLRNKLAHGLIDDCSHHGHMVCAWWFTLRLMMAPLVAERKDGNG